SASDSNPGTVTSSSFTLSTRSELSANAGGQIASATIGAGAVAGQILTVSIEYSFGNPASGADMMIQPGGNVSFDSSCFRLISVAIPTATGTAGGFFRSNGVAIAGTSDQLYFTNVTAHDSSQTLDATYT